MKTHVVAVGLLLTCLALLMPAASAQQVSLKATPKFDHAEMPLPENGRADMPVTVVLVAGGFACAQESTVTVALKLDSFSKWAGASMVPKEVTFKINPGQPGASEVKIGEQVAQLNIAWNVEDAPRMGARQEYFVIVRNEDVKLNGPCAPTPQATGGRDGPMTATLADRPITTNSTGPVDCASDPFQPVCQTAPTTTPPGAPGFDVGILLLSLAALGLVRRRHG